MRVTCWPFLWSRPRAFWDHWSDACFVSDHLHVDMFIVCIICHRNYIMVVKDIIWDFSIQDLYLNWGAFIFPAYAFFVLVFAFFLTLYFWISLVCFVAGIFHILYFEHQSLFCTSIKTVVSFFFKKEIIIKGGIC